MIPFRTADSQDRGLRSGSTFRSGSTWNKPGSARPQSDRVLNAPGPTRPVSSAPVTPAFSPATTVVQPSNVFANLISQAKNVAASRPLAGTKVGPGGATITSLRQVAETGVPPQTVPTPAPAVNRQDVLSNLIGGPAPGYGEKYAGLPSASYFADLIRGGATNILAAQQLAQEEANRLAAPIEEQYALNLDPTRGGLAGQRLQQASSILNQPLESLARQMAGGARFNPPAEDLYGANIARMNALRGTGDYVVPDETTGQLRPATGREQIMANAVRSVTPAAETQRDRDLSLFGATAAQELADAMAAYTPSELMQQIAIQNYGVDPALAAGMFPVSENLDYQQALQDAAYAEYAQQYGLPPDATTADIILATEGPDALYQYQLQQADYAKNGTPTQQLSALKNEQDAQNALFDEEARQTYGVDPGRVSGIDPEFMRDLLSDTDFTTMFTQARNEIVDGADPLEISADYGARYARESGDMLGARAMAAILASFDLQSFG